MQNQTPQQVLLVAARISRYLESRPDAFDSLEGIQRWWLLKQYFEESKEVVQAAMDYLVSNGDAEQITSNYKTFYASAYRGKTESTGDMPTENFTMEKSTCPNS